MTTVTTTDASSRSNDGGVVADLDQHGADLIEDPRSSAGSSIGHGWAAAIALAVLAIGGASTYVLHGTSTVPSQASSPAAESLDSSAARSGRFGAMRALTAADLAAVRGARR
jgi:hypothetical protein